MSDNQTPDQEIRCFDTKAASVADKKERDSEDPQKPALEIKKQPKQLETSEFIAQNSDKLDKTAKEDVETKREEIAERQPTKQPKFMETSEMIAQNSGKQAGIDIKTTKSDETEKIAETQLEKEPKFLDTSEIIAQNSGKQAGIDIKTTKSDETEKIAEPQLEKEPKVQEKSEKIAQNIDALKIISNQDGTKEEEEEEIPTPKKSKNQIKKERKKALWKENKEKWKELKKKKKLEKEAEQEDSDFSPGLRREKRKAEDDLMESTDIKKAKLETKALKAKRPGFSEERYNETSYFIENGLRKVYPYYFTFTTFTKGRWVGEKILDVFAKEFRAHPAEQYERCIKTGTLTVNYEKVDTDYRLKHNDLLANIVHRHEVPVTADVIPIVMVDEDLVVVDKPASIPVHPCGRYRHNTVVFILAKEYNLKNLRTIHRLDRLTSGLLLFGRTPKKAREMEQQIRTRQVTKEYVCRVEGEFPREHIECNEPIEVVSYKIGVCKVSPTGKDCRTEFQRMSYNGVTSVVVCRPHTGRMHQIRVHLQYLGYPIVNDPLYNHTVFGPNKAKGGIVGKTDEQLIQDLIKIHNAENWLGMDGDAEYSMFKPRDKGEAEDEGGSQRNTPSPKEKTSSSSSASSSPPTHHFIKTPLPPPPPLHHHHHTAAAAATTTAANGINASTATAGGAAGTVGTGASQKEYGYQSSLMTIDNHCYECKVRYRDPKPRDLVMYLHALKYSGPGWQFETKLPDWANEDWEEPEDDQ